MMPHYCANLKAIRYESMSLNRIVADKSHRVIVALVVLVSWSVYGLFSKVMCISTFHLSNPREIVPRKSDNYANLN